MIRRAIGRALLATELEALRRRLLPYQLVVGVKGCAEAMPHLTRQWMEDFAYDTDRVLLNTDECNARNEVDILS